VFPQVSAIVILGQQVQNSSVHIDWTRILFWVVIVLLLLVAIFARRFLREIFERKNDDVGSRVIPPARALFHQEDRTEILPSPPKERAQRAAAERRQNLSLLLEQFQVSLERTSEGGPRSLPVEFVEVPPTFSAMESRESAIESLDERAGQMARLRWQVKADQFLLAERVVDTILASRRYLQGSFSSGLPLIRLTCFESQLASRGLFPWKVVIETSQPEADSSAILQASEWLGIGVDFAQRRRIRPFGRCEVLGGLNGVVGGVLENGNEEYLMTCSHVLSLNCKSLVHHGTLAPRSNQPDAALIRRGNPCFKLSKKLIACLPADEDLLERIMLKKARIEKRHPDMRPRKGVIRSRVHSIPLNGNVLRFPHFEVLPWNSKLLRITRIFDSPFSKEGDSGSWVFDVGSGNWLGMVIAGDDYFTTFVAEALPLVDYFTDVLAPSSGLQSVLQPKYQRR
jgi:hypothetical protein